MLDAVTIALAIQLSAPNLNTKTNRYYARTIEKQSIKKNINPLIIVAIAAHESHWNAQAISDDREDWGLLQVRSRFVGMPSKYLLDGGTNIRVGSAFIVSSKNFCEKILHRKPLPEEWLSCYQGSCKSKRSFCKATNLSFKVESYAQCLYDSLLNQTSYNCGEIYKHYRYDGNYPID